MTTEYLTDNGWEHIFEGSTPRSVHWVLRRETDDRSARVVAALVDLDGTGFTEATIDQMRDIEESLVDANDIEKTFAEFDVSAVDDVPEWAEELVVKHDGYVLGRAATIDEIVNFYAAESSFHKDDELSNGANVYRFLGAVLRNPYLHYLPPKYESVVAALTEMYSTWSSGFDTASAYDFVTDDETIRDIFEEFLEDTPEPDEAPTVSI